MKKLLRFLISLLITIALLWLLLSKINLKDAWDMLAGANWLYLSLGIMIYIVLMMLRSRRFSTLLNDLPAKKIFPIILFNSFLSNVIPFKLGEVGYIVMIKKLKKSYSIGFATLAISRAFDFIVMIGAVIAAILFLKHESRTVFIKILPILIIAFVGIILLSFMAILHTKHFEKIIKKVRFLPNYLSENAIKLIRPFENFKSANMILYVFSLSIAIFLCSMLSTYFYAVALGEMLPVEIFVLLLSVSILSTFLPINGIGGFGTVEGIWTLTLSFFGYSTERAILLSFSLHIVQLIVAGILGLIGWKMLSSDIPAS